MTHAPRADGAAGTITLGTRSLGTRSLTMAALLYALLVFWLTWPLARFAGSSLPFTSTACAFDPLYATWVLSYESHALATAPSEFANGNIYHPVPRAIFYGPAGLGALPYFAPVFWLTGNPALAMNLTLLLCTALAALSLHWVVQRWTGRFMAGLVAGTTLVASPWILRGFVSTAPHLSALQYFPFILFLAARTSLTARQWLALLLLVVLQCLTDLVYVAPAVMAPLGVLAIARIASAEKRSSGIRLAVLIAAAAALLTPLYLLYLSIRRTNPNLAEQTFWRHREPALDLSQLFWHAGSPATIAPAALVLVIAGIALAAWQRHREGSLPNARAWQHGTLWLGVGIAIGLTPEVQWNGSGLPAPQHLLDSLTPFYQIFRTPTRLGIAALFGICILAGAGFAEVARWIETRFGAQRWQRAVEVALGLTAVAAIYLVAPASAPSLREPYPVREAPRVPAQLLPALTAGDGPLLNLPSMIPAADPRFAIARLNARAMYQSLFHWRPLLNGYASYWPEGFPERMELANRLPRPRALRQLVEETGVEAIWVSLAQLEPKAGSEWLAVVSAGPSSTGLDLIGSEGGELLFAVRSADSAPATAAALE